MVLKGAGYRFIREKIRAKNSMTKEEKKKIFDIVNLTGAVYYRTLFGRPTLKRGHLREDLAIIKKKISELGI